jgi:NADPH-dependent 2,4-dienoyl-CoA reductase/sulfur reductase-like enzyme/rhodanese-related sulfurtransferase
MSSPRRIVIIGGVAAGMSTATRLRRRDETAEIVVLERGADVSFANCGLAYHLGGVIPDRDALLLQTPERLAARFRIDVRTHTAATSFDPAARTVDILGPAGADTLHYDELVLATGASPAIPEIPGAERMHALRSLDDMDRIGAELDGLEPGTPVVVVGGGYIGLELVENLTHRGLAVTLVHRGDHVLGGLDPELAVLVEDILRGNGVDVRLGADLTSIIDASAILADGEHLPAALVLAATGVRPDSALARAAGLDLGPSGGVRVDELHRTSAPHVWAVGDVAEKVSAVDGGARLVTLAGPANREGRYVADAIVGDEPTTRPAFGTAILGLFGRTIASFGDTETALRAAGRAIRVMHTHPASHAGYYPGAETMAIKLIVDTATDRILGAQAVGGEGTDKRIDVLVTAAAAGLPASALADLELAYAPQFGSAKDPVNMLGYIDRNLRDGITASIQWHELAAEVERGALLVDVRSRAEHAAGHIPGGLNVPLEELRARANELVGRRVIVHCQVGQRGHTAAAMLGQLGIDTVNLDGGYLTWRAGDASRNPATRARHARAA